jgi:hypothetical protein
VRSDVVGVERLLGVVNPAAVDHELELVVSRILKAVESFLEKVGNYFLPSQDTVKPVYNDPQRPKKMIVIQRVLLKNKYLFWFCGDQAGSY